MKIWIIDDHPIVAEAMKSILSTEIPDLQLRNFGGAWNSALLQMREGPSPDLILLDLSMDGEMGGYRFLEQMKEHRLDANVVVLSMHAEAVYIERVMKLGARGYIVKSDPPTEILRVVKKVSAGEAAFSSTALTVRLSESRSQSDLSPREQEVAQHVLQGLTYRQIAARLGISYRTVECHRLNIMKKLNVSNAAQLVTSLRDLSLRTARKLAPDSESSLE